MLGTMFSYYAARLATAVKQQHLGSTS